MIKSWVVDQRKRRDFDQDLDGLEDVVYVSGADSRNMEKESREIDG
jgi:hypothetical protein